MFVTMGPPSTGTVMHNEPLDIPHMDDCIVMSVVQRMELAKSYVAAIGHQVVHTRGSRCLVANDGYNDYLVLVEKLSCKIGGADIAFAAQYSSEAGYERRPIVLTLGKLGAKTERQARVLEVDVIDRSGLIALRNQQIISDPESDPLANMPAELVEQALRLVEVAMKDINQNRLRREYWKPFVYRTTPGGKIIPPTPENIGPYDWQVDLHNAGRTFRRRGCISANRAGKSEAGSAETAMHATGDYPPFWKGKEFRKAPVIWVGADTNENSRETTQAKLLGEKDENGDYQGGFIPAASIVKITKRQAGVEDVVDVVTVRHKSGGLSRIHFKSYEQGRKKWQGTAVDFIWMDEEPPLDIYTEAFTRLMTTKGCMLLTFTPLNGVSAVVQRFLDDAEGDKKAAKEKKVAGKPYVITVGWKRAPHLDDEIIAEMLAAYPEHERRCRSEGVPLAGGGMVWPVSDDEIVIDDFPLPPHWARIAGIDFGVDHPFGAAWVAHDRDNDILYLHRCYAKSGEAAAFHIHAIRETDDWIPVSWPHDGMQRDRQSGKPLAEYYEKHGVNMLHISARYNDDKGGAQPKEPIVQELLDRMKTGKFKVFRSCQEFLDEKNRYHRKDGVIVASHDDVISATMYACMMRRFAVTMSEGMNEFGNLQTQSESFDPLDW